MPAAVIDAKTIRAHGKLSSTACGLTLVVFAKTQLQPKRQPPNSPHTTPQPSPPDHPLYDDYPNRMRPYNALGHALGPTLQPNALGPTTQLNPNSPSQTTL